MATPYCFIDDDYYEWRNGTWVQVDGTPPGVDTAKQERVDEILIAIGLGYREERDSHNFKETKYSVVDSNGKSINVEYGIRAENTHTTKKKTCMGASKKVSASSGEDKFKAEIEGELDYEVEASLSEVSAYAGAGWVQMGAVAGAEVRGPKASIKGNIGMLPVEASATASGAKAEAGVSLKYAGANVGAHLGEVQAGPFAARAGIKFGAGIRNGIPEVDMGPVTVPCCVM